MTDSDQTKPAIAKPATAASAPKPAAKAAAAKSPVTKAVPAKAPVAKPAAPKAAVAKGPSAVTKAPVAKAPPAVAKAPPAVGKVAAPPVAKPAAKAPVAKAPAPVATKIEPDKVAAAEAAAPVPVVPAPIEVFPAPIAPMIEAAAAVAAPIVKAAAAAPVVKAAVAAPVAKAVPAVAKTPVSKPVEAPASSSIAAKASTTPTIPQTKVPFMSIQSFKGYEDFAAFGKANLEAFVQANTLFAKGIESLSKEVVSLAQSSLESSTAATKAMFAAKTLKDVVELQADFAKTSFEKMVANSTKLGEMTVKLATDSAAPIGARVTAASEKALKPSA
jgi:phasin family protein